MHQQEKRLPKQKTLFQSFGIVFILLSFSIVTVSAYVFERSSNISTQIIQEILSITLKDSALGKIEEGQTIHYNSLNQSSLHQIIKLTITEDLVYLNFDSNLDLLIDDYETYEIVVKINTQPETSTFRSNDNLCVLTLISPDCNSIILDKAGTYAFDFEITTTSQSVDFDQNTSVTIKISAESTG